MLGLGMDMTRGGFVGGIPPISDLTLDLAALDSTTEDSGTSNPPSTSITLFDLRLYIASGSEYTGNPSDYTVTSLTVRNVTTGSTETELLSADLTMDSVIDSFGLGIIFYVFDNDSPMDDIDFGSASGSPHAHNGQSSPLTNTYEFTATITVNGYEGEATITNSFNLLDSDA